MNESEAISELAKIFSRPGEASAGVLLGIGDDAALIAPSKYPLAITTDTAIEGVHFSTEWSSPREIGSKITTANLADVCAMGGWPQYLVVAVGAPPSRTTIGGTTIGDNTLFEIAHGIAEEADRVGARVIGGDLSQSEKLMITITAIGNVEKTITRGGAHVGDSLYISQLPGWSQLGYHACIRHSQRTANVTRAINAFVTPQPDFSQSKQISRHASALTDVSDGLLLDASHIADASGVTIEIDPALVMAIPDFANLVDAIGDIDRSLDSLIIALTGGEDHEFLFTSSSHDLTCGFRIGKVIDRIERSVTVKGRELPSILGWSHKF